MRAFGAEARALPEPLGGLGELGGAGGVHAGEGGRELGAEGVRRAAFAGEFGLLRVLAAEGLEEFVEDAVAGFDGVEVAGLEGGAVDLVEAVAESDGAPLGFDPAAAGEFDGVEVAGAGGGLEGGAALARGVRSGVGHGEAG